jgi:predicted transcriptional regulator
VTAARADAEGDAFDRIEFLSRSPARIRLLAALRRAGPLTRDEIRGRLDASRTTVTRNVEALCEQGLARRIGNEYAIARAGELIADDYLDLAGTIAIARELEPFLEWVPEDALDVDLRRFADATVYTPEPGDPWSMINEHVRVIERTDYDRNVLNVVGLHGYETGHEKIVHGSARAELVVVPSIAETLCSDPRYAPLTEEMLRTGRFEVRVHEGPVPYFLSVLDGTVQLGATDDNGQPRALLESESEAVREWAEATYARYKRESRPFSMHPSSEP